MHGGRTLFEQTASDDRIMVRLAAIVTDNALDRIILLLIKLGSFWLLAVTTRTNMSTYQRGSRRLLLLTQLLRQFHYFFRYALLIGMSCLCVFDMSTSFPVLL